MFCYDLYELGEDLREKFNDNGVDCILRDNFLRVFVMDIDFCWLILLVLFVLFVELILFFLGIFDVL